MTGLVFFVEQIALGLYILIGAGLLIFWMRLNQAQRDLRATYYELERDIYRYRRSSALTGLLLLTELGLVVLGVQLVVAPTLRSRLDLSAMSNAITDLPFVTPTPPDVVFGGSPIDISGVRIGATEVVRVLATPTLTPTPVGTILPNPPAVEGCDTPNATLQVPANGMLVFEPLNVIGTAFTENFAFYRFELNGPQTLGNFAILRDYTQPVVETGVLGQFVPSFYQPGRYQFRVTVFDITNTLRAACTVNITISEPIPTPTPLRSG